MKTFIQALFEIAAAIRELARAITAASIKLEGFAYSQLKPKAEPKPADTLFPEIKKRAKAKGSRRWSTKEKRILIAGYNNGESYKEIAAKLNRTEKACINHVSEMKRYGFIN